MVEVGGAGTLEQSLKAVRFRGRISMIGVLSGPASNINVRPIILKGVRVQGIFMGSRESFETMNRAIGYHNMKPVVDRVFPFEESREAILYMQSGSHFGKVCIRVK